MPSSRTQMHAIEAAAFSIDQLHLVERPVPRARRGEILIRVTAASLNYRDLAVLSGTYLPDLSLPYVPVSDACGVIEALGDDVNRFTIGERVVPCYIQGWHDGALTQEQRTQRTLGGPLPGVLQQYIVIPAEDAIAAPSNLSDAEASTLPIAALTAWSCLMEGGLKTGDTVLVQGTGGVALFALQFAKASGARVIALTSSSEKANVLRQLGADEVINYRQTPEWAPAVREATDGRGVELIVETTGTSLSQSLAAVAFGGFVGVIGFVGGYETSLNIRQLIGPRIRIHGIVVGSRAGLEALSRAILLNDIKPIIDASFSLQQSAEAFRYMKAGSHMGKIVISL